MSIPLLLPILPASKDVISVTDFDGLFEASIDNAKYIAGRNATLKNFDPDSFAVTFGDANHVQFILQGDVQASSEDTSETAGNMDKEPVTGGFITGEGSSNIGIVITKTGTVTTTGSAITLLGSDSKITNHGKIDGGLGIVSEGDDNLIINHGALHASSTGVMIGEVSGNSIFNFGQIQSASMNGIDVTGTDNSLIANFGEIVGEVDGFSINGDENVLKNYRLVLANDDGVAIRGENDTLLNFGEMRAGDDGVELAGDAHVLKNFGLIAGGDDGLEMDGSQVHQTIFNRGSIRGVDSGIDTDINSAIRSSGTIEGELFGISIGATGTNTELHNSGVISGGRAGVKSVNDRPNENGEFVSRVVDSFYLENSGRIIGLERDGVDIEGFNVTVINQKGGLIAGRGTVVANSEGVNLEWHDPGADEEGEAVAGPAGVDGPPPLLKVVNYGIIESRNDEVVDVTVSEDQLDPANPVSVMILNYGILRQTEPEADEENDAIIDGSGVSDSVLNGGLVAGGVALESGDDRYETVGFGKTSGVIAGGEGDDVIIGGRFRDEMSGDAGDDRMTGGQSADIFRLLVSDEGTDTFIDLDVGEEDSGNDVITDFYIIEGLFSSLSDTLRFLYADVDYALRDEADFVAFTELLAEDADTATAAEIDGEDLVYLFGNGLGSVRFENVVDDDDFRAALLAAGAETVSVLA